MPGFTSKNDIRIWPSALILLCCLRKSMAALTWLSMMILQKPSQGHLTPNLHSHPGSRQSHIKARLWLNKYCNHDAEEHLRVFSHQPIHSPCSSRSSQHVPGKSLCSFGLVSPSPWENSHGGNVHLLLNTSWHHHPSWCLQTAVLVAVRQCQGSRGQCFDWIYR